MIKKYKYRFKTKDELQDEFGSTWVDIINFNNNGYMDYLLGKFIEVLNNYINDDGFCVTFFSDN